MKLSSILVCIIMGLLPVIFGCSTATLSANRSIVIGYESEEFGSYLRLFQAEAAKRGVPASFENTRFYFVNDFNQFHVNDPKKTVALCKRSEGMRRIYVSKQTWDTSDSLQRELTMFHEIGHCVYHMDHDLSTDSEGEPTSIMYPSEFDSYSYLIHRDVFLDQFFKNASESLKTLNAGNGGGRYECTK